jgi:hypothetical protein
MANVTIGYKVVRRTHEGNLVSASPDLANFTTTYHVGKPTRPRVIGTRLLAFNNEDRARAFMQEMTYRGEIFEIWRAILFNAEPILNLVHYYTLQKAPSKIWKELLGGRPYNPAFSAAPFGTLACSQIQLQEFIETTALFLGK